jgi:hypothetical protein
MESVVSKALASSVQNLAPSQRGLWIRFGQAFEIFVQRDDGSLTGPCYRILAKMKE